MQPIPHSSCFKILSKLVESKYRLALELNGLTQFRFTPTFGVLAFATLLESQDPAVLAADERDLRTFLLTKSSYGRDKVRDRLEELLSLNAHLKSCCVDVYGLARAMELIAPDVIQSLSSTGIIWNEGGAEPAVASILSRLFECEYEREICIHLYNLDIVKSPFEIEGTDAVLVRLDQSQIPALTGEQTHISTIHNPNTGNCFLRFADKRYGDDQEKFVQCWETAYGVLTVCLFMQYGILDLDYGGVSYKPRWVNHIRKFGIHMWGQPRRDAQRISYVLDDNQKIQFLRYWKAYQKLSPMLADTKHPLRRTSALAGDYYESHRKKQKHEEQLIDLTIALEVMFSPGKDGEHRFRIAHRAALLLGKTPKERTDISKFIRDIYDSRSKIVHTGESPLSEAGLSGDDVRCLGTMSGKRF